MLLRRHPHLKLLLLMFIHKLCLLYSTRDPTLNIFSDQHYALEPTFKSTGPYDCPQPPKFPPNTEKLVMTEEQEEIAKKLRNLELTMKNLQGLRGYKSISYKDLCMFPGVHLPLGFKMPKFEKYNGHGDPVAHLRRYCNQLRGAGGKKRVLKLSESAIRWHEQATRVKLPMKKSKIVEVFIQAQDETYYQYLLPALGKPFIEVLKIGEMIEDGIKTGHIVSFATLKATTQAIQKGLGSVGGKKNEEGASAIIVGQQARNLSQNPLYSIPPSPYQVYNVQPYVQPPSYPHWRVPTRSSYPPSPHIYRSPSRFGFQFKPNNEMRQKSRDNFTSIGESYASLFHRLVQQDMITPLFGYTPDPHSRSFDPNVRCAYHSDVQGHSIEDCRALKREIEKMIQDESIMVQNIDNEKSSSHADMQTSG
ncbi:hypothetical protein FXO37_15228 [Capsicum annuum]|nr:hypothetical protein FXO37_15228 [Capsicum annuum]